MAEAQVGDLADLRLIDEQGMTRARRQLGRERVQTTIDLAIICLLALADARESAMSIGDDQDDSHESVPTPVKLDAGTERTIRRLLAKKLVAKAQRTAAKLAEAAATAPIERDEDGRIVVDLSDEAVIVRRRGDSTGLPPAECNFSQHVEHLPATDTAPARWQPHAERWSTQQLAGFFWWRVCQWREGHGLLLTMPLWGPERGRLMADVKSIVTTSRDKAHALKYLDVLATEFDFIRAKLGRLGDGLELGISTILHPAVKGLVMQMADWTRSRLAAEKAALAEEQRRVA